MSTYDPQVEDKYLDDFRPDEQYPNIILSRDRSHSIDMSLELEHQLESLDIESTSPISPVHKERPLSLDPLVLQSLVGNLRQALYEVTSEKEDCAEQVAIHAERESELKHRYDLLLEECENYKAEIVLLNKKCQDDDEAISMLRAKVEESRRGLMRIQAENRRASQINSDGTKPTSLFTTGSSSNKKDKRASFTPLTGSGTRINTHRRIVSLSGTASLHSEDGNPDLSISLASPNSQFNFSEDINKFTIPSPSNHRSGLFGRSSSEYPSDISEPLVAQVEMLRQDLSATKVELEDARKEMLEARDARDASEQCVAALRQFITDNAVGEQKRENESSVKSVPTSAKSPEQESKRISGWSGLRLWRVDTKESVSSRQSETESANTALTSPTSEATPQTPAAVSSPLPISRKIGGFFSSRASVSSNSSMPHYISQEPMLNGSDTSSMDSESVSPKTADSLSSFGVQETGNISNGGEKLLSLDMTYRQDTIYLDDENHSTPIAL